MKSYPDNEMAKRIRAAFRASGLSMKRLSVQSGVYYSAVHGFIMGTRDPSLSTAARLCKVLGLELRPARRGKRKGR